jgi:ribosomal protein L37AE/L43A
LTKNASGNLAEMPPSESWGMKVAKRLGKDKIAWSLRRLHCPVNNDVLVLEVGSGGNPYFRANVLMDAYENTQERHWVPLVSDRPTVLGFVENLPFKDLEELQRVASGGYIEVPDAFMERINPYHDHRLEITLRQGRLLIRKKGAWQIDPDIVELYEDRVKKILTQEVIPSHPFAFHVRYFWKDKIDYEIVNPESAMQDDQIKQRIELLPKINLRGRMHSMLGAIVRALFSQRVRNSKIDIVKLLRCPSCHHNELSSEDEVLVCKKCGKKYPMQNGVPNMTDIQE